MTKGGEDKQFVSFSVPTLALYFIKCETKRRQTCEVYEKGFNKGDVGKV